jgi:hypothetical protein
MNDYTSSTSVEIDEVHVVLVFSRINQWDNHDEICFRTQFSLLLTFAIIIHKNQNLTLSLVVLNFDWKNNFVSQSYVTLSRVREIESVAFDSSFFFNRFLVKSFETIELRIRDDLLKQDLCTIECDSLTRNNVDLESSIRESSARENASLASIILIDDVDTQIFVDRLELLRDLIVMKVVQRHFESLICAVSEISVNIVRKFYSTFASQNKIALTLEKYLFLQRIN